MIGKLKKGSSFGGCIRYVTGKDEAKIIASDGVLLGTNAEMMQSFELQRQLNPRIKKPVGHIALSFKPEDKPRLAEEFQLLGILHEVFEEIARKAPDALAALLPDGACQLGKALCLEHRVAAREGDVGKGVAHDFLHQLVGRGQPHIPPVPFSRHRSQLRC